MATSTHASPADQERLLELQRLDTALDRARARMQQLRQDADYQTLQQQVTEARTAAEQRAQELTGARRVLTGIEDEVTKVREHRERDQQRLDAGQGAAKELEKMMHEVDTLARLQDEHESRQLEAMESLDAAEAADAAAQQQLTAAEQASQDRARAVKAEAAEVSAEGKRLTAQHAELASSLPEALISVYQKARQRNGGTGAARLVGKRSEASGVPLSPADLDEIRRTPEDQLAFCPDSGAILVRTHD